MRESIGFKSHSVVILFFNSFHSFEFNFTGRYLLVLGFIQFDSSIHLYFIH
jgi:hypothetical protein